MKVFLLRIDQRRHTFYAPRPEVVGDPGPDLEPAASSTGWLGRLRARRHAIQETIEHGRGPIARCLRRLWDWLQRFVAPDEPLLRSLRHVEAVVLHHPATMDGDAARDAWFAYLAGRWRHHLLWGTLNLVLCPLSLVIAVVPGPNVVGYWFVYRASCHALALVGVRRARHRAVRTVLEPTEALNTHLAGADRAAVDALAEGCGLDGLDVFLVRIGVPVPTADTPDPEPEPEPEPATDAPAPPGA